MTPSNGRQRRREATYRRGYEDGVAAATSSCDPVAYLRHGEQTFVQNVPFGAMWISDRDDPRSFPVYDRPQLPAPSVAVKALEWEAREDGSHCGTSAIGRYHVFPGTGFSYDLCGPVGGRLSTHKRLSEAKAAAQADYEARIRSALSAQAQDLAVEDVFSEVRRQVEVEGWSADHDDAHDKGEMAGAAACYALEGVTYTAPDHYPPRKKYAAVVDARNSIPEKERETTREAIKLALGEPAAPRNWPWHASWWKPTTTRRNLVKAAALLISEIKRLDRAAAPAKQEGGE